jgi:predicted transcriptional regulator YdeE
METKIVVLPEIRLLGVPFYTNVTDGGIGKSWDLMIKSEKKVNWKSNFAYGLECYDEEFETENKWFYMAAMEVDSFTNISQLPSNFFAKVIPASTYLVATTKATPEAMSQTFKYLYYDYIPHSEYQVSAYYDFEFYGPEFKGMNVEDSYVDLYIPVTKR